MSDPGLARRLWFRWKSLRLPWRRNFLVGHDLAGNTFWVFKDALNANRWRRIVRYGRQTHYADVKISPQWHSWLRHTRPTPPTIQEQQYEVSRQAMMRQLAAEADERWKSQPSYLDAPDKQQPQPAIGVKDPGGYALQTEDIDKQGVRSAVDTEVTDETPGQLSGSKSKKGRGAGPWENSQPKGNPGENWQPEQWSGGTLQRR